MGIRPMDEQLAAEIDRIMTNAHAQIRRAIDEHEERRQAEAGAVRDRILTQIERIRRGSPAQSMTIGLSEVRLDDHDGLRRAINEAEMQCLRKGRPQ